MWSYTALWEKHICCYCLQVSTKKCHDIKSNGKQMTKMPEYVRFKNYERKIKSPFRIYAYFGSI